MSLATWKKEFYPSPATRIKTKKGALAHSLRKWKGLTKANLKKHGVKIGMLGDLFDGTTDFSIDAYSCALCHLFHTDRLTSCAECPLVPANNGLRCGESVGGVRSPFTIYCEDYDPNPMIKLLEKSIKLETAK